ncbi:poly(R)-hydroxyalkanoic acid synthase, class III, PhaC subunit [Neobacillus bataviensis LMG 21833]|uniref:Poly(R)-hydroxyalkanoic acid synthase, class III, PhaC subunit n=1 Tax=Neobacillus bataviensis LMG 21833 TaxID=1117379 RepID=K6EC48_9BACI|nr:alpha/beta fold hydrolase [Neobacillus bataviensis]EKN70981.1 poly(R)-hydroxyalkanoic acid synthase, class III, PhaC subunit [Neobacillus bataviensis LMG 21833]
MTTDTEMKTSFDFEKELTRWNEFFKTINGPELSTELTPRQLIWKKNKATLWHYSAVERKYDVPIFFVYSLFNRPNILDFAPGSSVIEGLVNSGYDVYLLDWGIAGYEDKDINLEDYIVDYIKKSVQRVLRHSAADEVSVVGYCLGGTLAAMYASIADEPIKNLVVATVPIDFSVAAIPDKLANGIKEGAFNIERFVGVYGIIPPSYVEAMFRSVTSPVYNSPYVTLLTRANDKRFVEKWRRMNNWTKGHVPLTGGALQQINNDLFKENKLVKGEFTIRGVKADLRNIQANLMVVSSKNDNLIPEEQSLPLMDLVSSKDKTYQLVEAGHVSLAISGKLSGILDQWLCARSRKN